MSNENVVVDLETVYTMAEAKALLKKAKAPIGGLKFFAQETKGGVLTGVKVLAEVLPELSPRGKIQAVLEDADGGPTHIREQSDWHQCMRAPKVKGAKTEA